MTPLDEELILGFERILRADREFRSVEPPERLAFGFVWEQPDPDDVDARCWSETLEKLAQRLTR